jgi:hypothetical protein
MRLTEARFLALMTELVDDNPFAVRPVLKILTTEFTAEVPTLAVSLEERPRLLVNLEFLSEHCRTDEHVKACIAHEFLHVVLNHTEQFKKMSPAQNLALDAVINAIIHRTLGEEYSEFFLLYYRTQTGDARLLRRRNEEEAEALLQHRLEWLEEDDYPAPYHTPPFDQVWDALYKGKLVADDILGLARERKKEALQDGRLLIGNHDGLGQPLPGVLREAIEDAMTQMNGSGIWRAPKERGVGAVRCARELFAKDRAMERWRAKTLEVLRRCLTPSERSAFTESVPRDYRLPVLSPRDRRAFMRTLWSPLIPEASWEGSVQRPLGQAQVYLDVSGSMDPEMPEIVALLGLLRKYIRMPFWAFSDEVHPAKIEDGTLVTETTGGTSMACVLEHLARTRPPAAVVVTDGYIETLDRQRIRELADVRIHAVVTRDGHVGKLNEAGIPYMQLEVLPNG